MLRRPAATVLLAALLAAASPAVDQDWLERRYRATASASDGYDESRCDGSALTKAVSRAFAAAVGEPARALLARHIPEGAATDHALLPATSRSASQRVALMRRAGVDQWQGWDVVVRFTAEHGPPGSTAWWAAAVASLDAQLPPVTAAGSAGRVLSEVRAAVEGFAHDHPACPHMEDVAALRCGVAPVDLWVACYVDGAHPAECAEDVLAADLAGDVGALLRAVNRRSGCGVVAAECAAADDKEGVAGGAACTLKRADAPARRRGGDECTPRVLGEAAKRVTLALRTRVGRAQSRHGCRSVRGARFEAAVPEHAGDGGAPVHAADAVVKCSLLVEQPVMDLPSRAADRARALNPNDFLFDSRYLLMPPRAVTAEVSLHGFFGDGSERGHDYGQEL